MIKVADEETECYSHGNEVRVETHLYFVDDNGDKHPVNEIYALDAEPIDDYDTMNMIKFSKFDDKMFSITAKADIPIAFKIGLNATMRLQERYDLMHRMR